MILRRTIPPLLAFVAVCFCVGKAKAQDPQFTQFYANKLYLNPAFAGSYKCPRAIISYRDQWPGLTGQGSTLFRTISASYDQHFDEMSGGLGLLVTQDDAASTLSTTRVSGIYSYQLKIDRKFNIRAGFQATWFQRKLDWSKLTFGDMIDPRKGFIYNTQNKQEGGSVSGVDFSAGVIGNSEKYFFGAAVHHMTEPDESLLPSTEESPLPMKITGHAGANIPLVDSRFSDDAMTLSPNILFQQQGNFQQLNLGAYLQKGPIVGGLWYRNRDAFIALIGFQKGIFKFGYSYDVTISSLSSHTQGAHELSLTLNFDCPPEKKDFRTISCPSF
ncbi:MAG: type IX secretion system membrane protein PorP/SprF [Flavobacteriales bacterium]